MLQFSSLLGREMEAVNHSKNSAVEAENHVKHGARSKSLMSRGNFIRRVGCMQLLTASVILFGCLQKPNNFIDDETFFKFLKTYVDSCTLHHAERYEDIGLDRATTDSITKFISENTKYTEDGRPISPQPPPFNTVKRAITENKSTNAQNYIKSMHVGCIRQYIHYNLYKLSGQENLRLTDNVTEKLSTLNFDLIFKFENKERPNRVTGIDHEDFRGL